MWVTLCAGFVVAAGCGSSTHDCGCASGETCIMGGHCAPTCDPDGGTICPSNTSCVLESGYCQGTACSAIAVHVCCGTAGC
jgi:hypothetical protein